MKNLSDMNPGFPGLFTLFFIALKLTGVVGWSWWWVLSPIWITAGLMAVVFAIVGVLRLVSFLFE